MQLLQCQKRPAIIDKARALRQCQTVRTLETLGKKRKMQKKKKRKSKKKQDNSECHAVPHTVSHEVFMYMAVVTKFLLKSLPKQSPTKGVQISSMVFKPNLHHRGCLQTKWMSFLVSFSFFFLKHCTLVLFLLWFSEDGRTLSYEDFGRRVAALAEARNLRAPKMNMRNLNVFLNYKRKAKMRENQENIGR